MISKAKRVITLGKKACIVCQKQFQPGSGAQMTCSPQCKAEAKAKGLTKRRPRGGVDPALVQDDGDSPPEASAAKTLAGVKRFSEIDPGISQVTRTDHQRDVKVKEVQLGIPELELDLTPIEIYIRAVVKGEVQGALKGTGGQASPQQDDLRDDIREVVKEEIAERLKGLLGR